MRNLFFAVVLALAMGCDIDISQPKFGQVLVADPSGDPAPRATPVKRMLRLFVPSSWNLKTGELDEIMDDMTTECIVQGPTTSGKKPATLIIASSDWHERSEDFAAGMVFAMVDNGIPIKKAHPIYVSGVPASLMRWEIKGSVMMQVNVAFDGRAYIVLCTGLFDDQDAIGECESILNSLELESIQSPPVIR